MPFYTSLPQAGLAAATLLSTAGTFIALTPPNPSPQSAPSTGDFIRKLNLTNKNAPKVVLSPLGLLALHSASLAYFYPSIPSSILRHGAENGLNTDLITWSKATSIPLALILCAGVPLRLISYSSLGKNFTFALSEPDRLKTDGIYRYVQHPSYTGVFILTVCNMALLCKMDGVVTCWIPPQWYPTMRFLARAFGPIGFSLLIIGIWTRVRQEERMLQAKFSVDWEKWHATTARFIPWVF